MSCCVFVRVVCLDHVERGLGLVLCLVTKVLLCAFEFIDEMHLDYQAVPCLCGVLSGDPAPCDLCFDLLRTLIVSVSVVTWRGHLTGVRAGPAQATC